MLLKTTHLTRTTILLTFFFAVDKVLAVIRQIVIARQFGLSKELDAFNVANNIPDLLFALISGGALAVAFIPILSETLTLEGRNPAWKLFSNVANIAFLVTALLAILTAVFAGSLVGWEVGIAPGFGEPQQRLVIKLMRMNLIATMIFSISGLVMAGLQANKHFLLPAIAPIFYNIGQILGAIILSPADGYKIGSTTLPHYAMGVEGLVVGVIFGAAMHLCVQIPGLITYQFQWTPSFGFNTPQVNKVIKILAPRLMTMMFIQLIFIVRDNLASRLEAGAVTSLTYGWMLQQVPETLIGTAIGTALLPTLAEYFANKDTNAFQNTIVRAIRVLISLTIPISAILAVGFQPLLGLAFGFDLKGTELLMWVFRGFLVGLFGHCLLEITSRSFYAQQNANIPLFGAIINLGIYIFIGSQLYRIIGAPGISVTDSLAFTFQAVLLLFVLINIDKYARFSKKSRIFAVLFPGNSNPISVTSTHELYGPLFRASLSSILGCILVILIINIGGRVGIPSVVLSGGGMLIGFAGIIPIIWKDVKVLLRL